MPLLRIISNFREIIGTVSKYTSQLQPYAQFRLVSWLVYESMVRKPGLPSPDKKFPRQVQSLIEKQVSLFMGYMVLFAHDDAVDKFNFNTAQIYDQLSRYLSAFLLGLSISEEASTFKGFSQELQKWLAKLHEFLQDSPNIAAELSYLLVLPKNLTDSQLDGRITIHHLLFGDEHDEIYRDWLNASIVSSMGMGRAFREILLLLEHYLAEDKVTLEARSEYFVTILVMCMYAQAHSPEQKNMDTIRYDRFIKLSYLKSTVLLDLYHYVNDLVNEKRFFATRHNAARVCSQILDDMKDYKEDTLDQILNIIHMHILEQGRLAEKFLSIPDRKNITISIVKETLSDTKILQTNIDEAFVYQNPFVQAARNIDGNLRMESNNAETILRELWVNLPNEIDWPIERLALHRSALSNQFRDAWREKNYSVVLDVIHISNCPLAILESLYRFVNRTKRVGIEAYTQHGAPMSGYIGYYSYTFGLRVLWLSFWIKRVFRLVLYPKKFSSYFEKRNS